MTRENIDMGNMVLYQGTCWRVATRTKGAFVCSIKLIHWSDTKRRQRVPVNTHFQGWVKTVKPNTPFFDLFYY